MVRRRMCPSARSVEGAIVGPVLVAAVVIAGVTCLASPTAGALIGASHRGRLPATVGAPSPPINVDALPASKSVTASWTTPVSDGGSPLSFFTVTASPGGATAYAGGSATTAQVTGLANGTAYNFSVTATNQAGFTSPLGNVGHTVTPAGIGACAISWSGLGGDGAWANSANWSPARMPATSDYACTPSGGGVVSVTSARVKGLKSQGRSLVVSGTLSLAAASDASVMKALSLQGGALSTARLHHLEREQ